MVALPYILTFFRQVDIVQEGVFQIAAQTGTHWRVVEDELIAKLLRRRPRPPFQPRPTER